MARLRLLLERPLDPATARLVVLLGGAVSVGFAVLVGLGLLGPGATGSPRSVTAPPRVSRAAVGVRPTVSTSPLAADATDRGRRRPQDPQDRPGSRAARRAHRELATHRALQHLPYRHGDLSTWLVGARDSKAVLEVRATSLAAARRGWRAFLRRSHDDGHAYLPRFYARGGRLRGAHPQAPPRARLRARHRATPIPARSGRSPHGTALSGARNLPRSPRHNKAAQ